ncbi:MAG: carbohydrate ABC transporter permease [Candidatus Geothermarchaeales archaeon]
MIFRTDSIRERRRRIKIVTYIGALVILLYVLLPVIWMFLSSIQTDDALTTKPFNPLPGLDQFFLDNYYFALTGLTPPAFEGFEAFQTVAGLQILPTLLNSLIVATAVAAITLSLGSICAYSFARIRFRLDRKLFASLMGSRLLPYITILIPIFIIVKSLGILDSLLSLILVYSAMLLPWRVWLLTIYFQSFPESIEEAARIDGCTRFQTLYRVVLPLSRPGLAAVGVFSFMEAFGEFIFALILTSTIASQTLPVTLAALTRGGLWYSRSLMMAVATVGTIPPVFLAVVFRKYVIEGLTSQFGIRATT